jgi:hypothetical protein
MKAKGKTETIQSVAGGGDGQYRHTIQYLAAERMKHLHLPQSHRCLLETIWN